MATDHYTTRQERLAKNYGKLEGLKALYAEWEKKLHPTDPYMVGKVASHITSAHANAFTDCD